MMVVMMLRATRRRHLPTPPVLSLRQRRHRPPSLPTFGPIRTQHTGNDSCRRRWSPRDEGKYWEFRDQTAWGRGFVVERRAFVTPWRAGLADLNAVASHLPVGETSSWLHFLRIALAVPPEDKVSVSPSCPASEAAVEV